MTAQPDHDDALSWAGDDDPTLVAAGPDTSLPREQTRDAPTVKQAEVSQGDAVQAGAVQGDSMSGQVAGSVALIGMGVLGGIYLLYAVGWFIGVSRIGNPIADPLGQFMFSLGAWLAVVSPLVWFGATYWLTIDRPRRRVLWLLLGVVLLAPVPFIYGVGAL